MDVRSEHDSMPVALRTRGLTKFYGRRRGIEDLDLDVRAEEVFGFLGPNGAGKTTTIRMLLGLIRPTRGEAQLLGTQLRSGTIGARADIGYLPGDLALYDRMTGAQVLSYLARLRGGVPDRRWHDLAERLGLDLTRRVRDLSRGNRQKVGVVQAFMHQPRLLVLDEPTSGLDPLVQVEFGRLVREAVDFGATVFLSSHVLAEVGQLADRVAIVDDGRLLVVDTVDGLREKATKRVELDFPGPPPYELRSAPGVRDVEVRGETAVCTVAGPVGGLLAVAVARGVVDVHTHDPDLEDAFLGYVAGGAR
jgi:ABC-2 type transport system ATP-binding protein